jgi:hypothetical protein
MEVVCREESTSAGNGTYGCLGVGAVDAYRKGGGITPIILNLDCTMRCVVSLTTRLPTPEERPHLTDMRLTSRPDGM